ncbi:MAG: hypothetical protein KDC58_12665 [Cyclobacteriaceae bacterium]|nr:hypothetical protein [Cyclobacteriaceae bacterium]
MIELKQTTIVMHDIATGTSSTNPFKKFDFRFEGETYFQKVGPFGNNIRPHLEENNQAIKHLNDYRTKRIIASAAIAGALGSFTTFAIKNLNDNELSAPGESGIKYTGWLGVTAGFVIIDILFAAISNNDMIKAVEAYNNGKKVGMNRQPLNLYFSSQKYNQAQSSTLGIIFTF